MAEPQCPRIATSGTGMPTCYDLRLLLPAGIFAARGGGALTAMVVGTILTSGGGATMAPTNSACDSPSPDDSEAS